MDRRIWIIIVIVLVVMLGIALVAEWMHTQRRGSADHSPQVSAAFGGPDWPIFRGNSAMTGVASGAFPDKFALAWKFKTGDAIKSSPVVADGRVFIGSQDKKVYAVALADGKPLWNFATKDAIDGSPSVADDLVFVGSNDSFVYALDAATGTLKWSFETGDKIIGSVNPARAADGKRILVFGSYDNNIYALDAAGAQLWKYETGNYVNGARPWMVAGPSPADAMRGYTSSRSPTAAPRADRPGRLCRLQCGPVRRPRLAGQLRRHRLLRGPGRGQYPLETAALRGPHPLQPGRSRKPRRVRLRRQEPLLPRRFRRKANLEVRRRRRNPKLAGHLRRQGSRRLLRRPHLSVATG